MRRAIALGRLSLDPLAVMTQLCGPGREVLSIKATELQDLLTPDERMAAVEQVGCVGDVWGGEGRRIRC